MNEDAARCIACGSDHYGVRLRRAACEVRECRTCRLAWTFPPSAVTLASYENDPNFAARYAAAEEKSVGYAGAFFDSVSDSLSGGTLLDGGCSVGTLVEVAERRGFQAEGIDLDHNAVEYGKSRGRSIHLSGLHEFDPASYDVLCLQHTLEHVSRPVDFLRECARHLAEGGCVIISLPCHDGWVARLFKQRWYGWQFNQHYFHYSKPALERVLVAAGFSVERCFQNSMDHGVQPAWRPLKGAVVSRLSYATAKLGTLFGRGDQLIAVGRRTPDQQRSEAGS